MLFARNCKISRKVSFEQYSHVVTNFNKIPRSMLEFHKLNIVNNQLIETLLGHIPFLHLDASYQIRNKWYKFQLCYTFGNVLRFAQLDVSSPLEGEQKITHIRFIDIEVM